MGVFFNGRYIESPTTASAVNDDGMLNQNLTVGNVVAFVGRSAGGKPKSALSWGSPDEARAELVSGELLDAVLKAFDPSNETGGPSLVIGVRVQPATQASGVIKDSGANTVINLQSEGYGLRENMIGYKVEAGSTTGLRFTSQRGSSYFTQDNLARKAFTVTYAGTEASATVAVTSSQVVLSAPAGTAVATILFADYGTVQDVVDRINLVPNFSATVEDDSYTSVTANGLDFVTAQSVKTAPYTVTADLQAVIDWINGALEGFIVATRPANVGTKPAVSAMQFLTGGSDGSTLNSDWADAFGVLQGIDAQVISPVSGDPSIIAMADVHAQYMSDVAGRERRAVCGLALSTSNSVAMAAAKAINSDRTALLFQGHYQNVDGKLKLFAPYISAAGVAGMFAGVNPGEPLTNKQFKCAGLERELRNPTDTDPLIKAGLLCLENTAAGFKVVKSISTWLVNKKYNRVEMSCGFALDFTVRNVREAVDVLRGTKANQLTARRAVSLTQSALKELAREEPQGPGVLAGNAETPPYRNITATVEGDVTRIQFECSPVVPNNYILVTVFAATFSGSATA